LLDICKLDLCNFILGQNGLSIYSSFKPIGIVVVKVDVAIFFSHQTKHLWCTVIGSASKGTKCFESPLFLYNFRKTKVNEDRLPKFRTEDYIGRLYIIVNDMKMVHDPQLFFQSIRKIFGISFNAVSLSSGILDAVIVND
jgi:hypothetical protein